jgi:hypothetical protein
MLKRFLPILALGLCCLGMGQKQLPITIRFYTQTSSNDTDSFSANVTLLNGSKTTVDDIAVISEHDIVAIYPFTAQDGSGGCAFKLDEHGTIGLDTVSTEKRGTLLIATINGRQISDIVIDKRVADGIVEIPNGITTDEMKVLLKKYPVLGGGGPGTKKAKKKDVYSVGL